MSSQPRDTRQLQRDLRANCCFKLPLVGTERTSLDSTARSNVNEQVRVEAEYDALEPQRLP